MMRDRPRGADLVAEARRVLTETVLPGLASETRYQALMVIRAMDLAEQEFRASPGVQAKLIEQLRRLLASEGSSPELFSSLSEHIRNGAFDASEELYAILRLVVAFKLKETNPSKIPDELKDSLDGLLID